MRRLLVIVAVPALLIAALAAVSPIAAAVRPSAGEDEFAAGEAAFRQGDNAGAEAHYRRALELDPDHLRALVRLATVVSWTDRLKESIGYFDRALSMDPGSVEIRLGLARTLSWDGQYDRAIGIYDALLKENPGNRDAALGLAQTLGWAGRHREAKEIYLQRLSDNPGDVEARNGLAAVLSWQGRLDDALDVYTETLTIDPTNKDALAGRARVLYWQGRTPRAHAALEAALREHPNDREALKLDASMRRDMEPVLDASAGVVHDTDRNAISLQHAGATYLPAPAWTVSGSVDRFQAIQFFAGNARLREELVASKALATWRVTSDLDLTGSVGVDQVTGLVSHAHMSGLAGAAYRLDDHWSFSGTLSRSVFAATALSLVEDVGISTASATAAFTPVSRLSTRLTLERDNFTDNNQFNDDNQRDLLAAYARWAIPLGRPKIGLSWSLRDLSCAQPGTGYFCPDFYIADVGGLDLADRIGPRFGWNLSGSLGLQRVGVIAGASRDTDTVRGYHASITWDFDAGITVEAYVGRTNLALAQGAGFASTESGFRVRWRLGDPRAALPAKAATKTGETK